MTAATTILLTDNELGIPSLGPPYGNLDGSVIPGEPKDCGRDPWFDRPFDKLTVLSKVEGLTTLSEVEGESRKQGGNQIILDPPPNAAGDDELLNSL